MLFTIYDVVAIMVLAVMVLAALYGSTKVIDFVLYTHNKEIVREFLRTGACSPNYFHRRAIKYYIDNQWKLVSIWD